MKKKLNSRLLAALITAACSLPLLLTGQTTGFGNDPSQAPDPSCTAATGGIVTNSAFVNYGGSARMKNSTRRMRLTVGQMVVGEASNNDYGSSFGFWSALLVAPLPPMVTVTQGELLDRIQLKWAPNPLGSAASGGWNIYRDGIFLASVDKNIRSYNDFNVIAGQNYVYEVRAVNLFGEGAAGTALGFQVPNGVATGWVRTVNGNAVPGAQVTLTPMQGNSVKFNQFDGGFATAGQATDNFLPTTAATDWSITFYMRTKNVAQAVSDVFRLDNNSLACRSSNSQISFEVPGATLSANYPSAFPTDWLHVALTFHEGQYRLYVDGALKDFKNGTFVPASPQLDFGARTPFDGWEGNLDELRIYHRRVEELELTEIREGTASSLTPGLKYYWKMDEGAGTKAFDILQRTRLYFCGAIFDTERAPVHTAGVTNDDGYYRIEGANYGTGTTFLATPTKYFYKHRALKFIKAEKDYATLPDFPVGSKATIEMWVNQDLPTGDESLLYKQWGPGGGQSFNLRLVNGQVVAALNGVEAPAFGVLGLGYHHLAVTLKKTPGNTVVEAFVDGNLLASRTLPLYTGDFSEPGLQWLVGTLTAAGSKNFGGLIDEIAVYDTVWPQAAIQSHFQNDRDPQEPRLKIHFALDEGSASTLSNAGSFLLTETGTAHGTEWTTFANHQSTVPHDFAPGTRQVTLNPSVTSVDQVDFTDRSTVAVTGFIRYANTDCFARNFEILVNGESYLPPVYTDTTGKFTIDVEPGATVTVRPSYKDHEFFPEEITLSKVVSPVAGIVFNDITTRKIKVKVAGGDCKAPILDAAGASTVCVVTVSTTDGCFTTNNYFDTPDEDSGEFEFTGLPPLKLTVAVTEHSDPAIKTAFQVSGGTQVDMSEKQDTSLDFIYYAPPVVELTGLPVHAACNIIVLEQHAQQTINIKLKELYYKGTFCTLDTGDIKLINGFEDSVRLLKISSAAGVNYTFTVGRPSSSIPYMKTLQVVGTNLAGNESQLTVQGIVTGINTKHNTFTTALPQMPSIILHDPPGDGSFSFIEKGEKLCRKMNVSYEVGASTEIGVVVETGPAVYNVVAPLGYGLATPIDADYNYEGFSELSYVHVNDTTFETCMSFDRRISTGDNDLIVGSEQGGDVYIGSGMNIEFGFADRIGFDTLACSGTISTVLNVVPGLTPTTFIYSEWGVRENVIRFLDSLRVDPNATPADSAYYAQSMAMWEQVLDDNKAMRDSFTARENISFDAGPVYEYSITTDTSTTDAVSNTFDGKVGLYTEVGVTIAGIGGSVKIRGAFDSSGGTGHENGTEKGTTTGYTLTDDDLLDAFSVDVGIDPRYGTAIFRTKTGQSSCPWEPNTAHREGNSMEFRDGSGPVQLDVPADQPAVFLFNLGNESETNETWTFAFTAGPESNAHGAKIKINGAPCDVPVMYAIPWGTVVPITVTLERGPIEYEYDSLEVVFYSLCEDIRANELGILPDDDKILYSAQYISAHFIKPCSEVAINVPEQNWVVWPDPLTPPTLNDNVRRITVSGYDKANTDFEKIRVQYRRSDGNGAWINIVGPAAGGNPDQDPTGAIVRDSLGGIFTQYFWDTEGLADGPYEIRAVSICSGNVADRPGYSQIIKGRIDRQPPSLIGTPEPSDGVLNVGDEISFSFNKDIACSKLNAIDNVKLINTTTGLPIDIEITCKDNKIILRPTQQNAFVENLVLRAELHDIEDLVGNNLVYEQWEFYVDRNELAWLTDSVGATKYPDEQKFLSAKIVNRGGYPVPFTIQNIPPWAQVTPTTGTLAPDEVKEIQFMVDSTLAIGNWSDDITLHTVTGINPFFMGGDENLKLGARVLCRPPNWSVNPSGYQLTMNMVVRLKFNGTFSSDPEDMVAVFIGGQLRGMAKCQFVPQMNWWVAFLTVYGEAADANKALVFEMFDASECLRYPGTLAATFVSNSTVGMASNPTTMVNASTIMREVPLTKGWNWISLNLSLPATPSTTNVLNNLPSPVGDLVKDQTKTATYDAAGSAWVGTLSTMNNRSLYLYQAAQANTLKITGNPLTAASFPITVVTGWNWIGYPPSYSLPINTALASITGSPGDIIKGQTSFAQYLNATSGWVGNLTKLSPLKGYQMKLATGGTLTYPPSLQDGEGEDRGGEPAISSFWTVDAAQFEANATIIGMLQIDGSNATTGTMEIGAFVGSECRGASTAIYVESLHAHLFFLTTYANTSGELLTFKLFDSATGQVADLAESFPFEANAIDGSLAGPLPFGLKSTGASVEDWSPVRSFEVVPNPFHGETSFLFSMPEAEEVSLTITDVDGRTVADLRSQASRGANRVVWPASTERLAAGVYFVRLQTASGAMVRKVVLQ